MQLQDFLRIDFDNTVGIGKAFVLGTLSFKQMNPIQDS